MQEAPAADAVEVWKKGVCADTFHPRFRSDAMRARLAGGPGAPADASLLLSVGRLGNEKNLKFLRVGATDAAGFEAGFLSQLDFSLWHLSAHSLAVHTSVAVHSSAPSIARACTLIPRPCPPDLHTPQDVLERTPGARLAFVGDGPAREELKAYFAGTPTTFMGMLHGEELSAAYASADVFVMPSETETLGAPGRLPARPLAAGMIVCGWTERGDVLRSATGAAAHCRWLGRAGQTHPC